MLFIPKDRIKLYETLVNKRRGLEKFNEVVFLAGLESQVLYGVLDVDILEFWKKLGLVKFSKVTGRWEM